LRSGCRAEAEAEAAAAAPSSAAASPAKAEADALAPLRRWTAAADGDGVAQSLSDAAARVDRAKRCLADLDAKLKVRCLRCCTGKMHRVSMLAWTDASVFLAQERRAATALSARELEVTRAVARDGLAGMSRAAAAEAACAAEATAARGAAAGAAAARAEALAAGLTEGMRAMLARLEAAATSAAPFCDALLQPMHLGAVTDARAAAALVDALEDAARGAVAAAERRRVERVAAALAAEAASTTQPAVDHEPQQPRPAQSRPRRRVRRMSTDSDGFAYSRSGSETESGGEETTGGCSDSDEDDDDDGIIAAHAEPFVLCGDASSATVGVPAAPPSVAGSVAASAAPETSRGSDGCALVTRDALKELAAAAARLQRLPAHRGDLAHAGSGPQATSAAAHGGGAAGLLGAARRERAPPARLLSSRTPSADALLHSLQALSRDVDSRTLPSVLRPPTSASCALDALPRKALQVSSPAPSPARRARSATPTAGGRRRGSVAVALASVTSAAGFAVPRPAASTAAAAPSGRFAAAAAAARGGAAAPMPARARATSPERVRRPAVVPAPSSPMGQPFRSASAGAARAPSRGRTASPAPVRPALSRPPPGALYAAAAAAARSSGGPGSRGGTPTAGRGRASSPAASAAFGATTLRLRTKA